MCNSQNNFSAVYKVTMYKTIKLIFITTGNLIAKIISLELGDFTPDPKDLC